MLSIYGCSMDTEADDEDDGVVISIIFSMVISAVLPTCAYETKTYSMEYVSQLRSWHIIFLLRSKSRGNKRNPHRSHNQE